MITKNNRSLRDKAGGQGREYFTLGETVLIIDSNLIMVPNLFSHIFVKEVSMYFINKLISLFTREIVRSIALKKVFVKQSFNNFNMIIDVLRVNTRGRLFQILRSV